MAGAAGAVVAVADIAANHLVYVPANDANGAASFTFKVQDDGGTANDGVDTSVTANTVTINVTPVNDAAVIGSPTNATVTEDASSPTLTATGVISITDVDGPSQQAFNTTVTAASGTSASR